MAELPQGDLKRNWAYGLETGVLRLPKCAACGHWNWYPLAACRICQHTVFDWTAVSSRGRIYSWTRVHRSFVPGLKPPYVVALVEPDDAPGVRLTCRQSETGASPVIGDTVVLMVGGSADAPVWCFRSAGCAP